MTLPDTKHPYKRILLKLSGEVFMGADKYGLDDSSLLRIAGAIKNIRDSGYEIGIVIGGGNIFRGLAHTDSIIQRSPADQMGMLATLINGIALKQYIASLGCPVRLLTALDCPRIAESYRWENAIEYIANGEVLIFAGGTGNPYFTTDTAAALRAKEIDADLFLKATKVDGVYNKDPFLYKDALRYEKISFTEALSQNLKVMDSTAFALCMTEQLPVFVFNMDMLYTHTLQEILQDKTHGTLVKEE